MTIAEILESLGILFFSKVSTLRDYIYLYIYLCYATKWQKHSWWKEISGFSCCNCKIS